MPRSSPATSRGAEAIAVFDDLLATGEAARSLLTAAGDGFARTRNPQVTRDLEQLLAPGVVAPHADAIALPEARWQLMRGLLG